MPRDMIENERSSSINPSEAVEEKVSLSDRFGLWLGFHPCDQDQYLAMIRGYCDSHGVEISDEDLRAEAIEWQATRGARSGRVAWQFVVDLGDLEEGSNDITCRISQIPQLFQLIICAFDITFVASIDHCSNYVWMRLVANLKDSLLIN